MRLVVMLAAIALATTVALAQDLPLLFQDDFEKGAERWQPTDTKAWKVDKRGETNVFHQFRQSQYTPPFRSPLNFALVKDLIVGDFVLEAKALSTAKDGPHRDMCLFWGYQDSSHYYYAHIAKQADDRANQIFIVNGKERVKISSSSSKGTPWDDKWHNIKLVRKANDGDIAVYWDDMKSPIMTAKDATFAWGQVGVGSFDDTGLWDDVKISGIVHKK
ncbi:MAG: hypothetical protein WCL32_10060 [Planctomycetota bacterium]